ncbi:MAG: transglutaminase domain-containing protein [Candidatus Pacearchaeota archaeon]
MQKIKLIFKLLFAFLILISICATSGKAETSKTTEVEVRIFSTISSSSNVEAELFAFPRNTTTQQAFIETTPKAKITEEKIIFELSRSESFEVIANVTSTFNFIKIKKAPLLNAKFSTYLEATEYVDSNNVLIKSKAKQIENNVNSGNALELLHELAEYTRKSIHYSLAYSQPQKASWILENKIGVCSHYTTLFIAFCRALNIPARYVSGLAYEKEFVEHAWAEVYLPEYGWIPYDITFGQYGWLDASHIVLKYSKDPTEPSVRYHYTGNLEAEKLKIDAKIKEPNQKQDSIKIPFKINLKPYKDKVSLNSYVPLEVTIENENDFFFSLPIYLTVAPGSYGDISRIVFLKPKEKSKTFFIIYIPNLVQCVQGCIANITVKDFFNNTATTTIEFSKFYQAMTLEQAQAIVQNKNFDFFCSTDKEYYYENEEATVKCLASFEKKQSFQICLEQCFKFEDQNASVEFKIRATEKICPKINFENKVVENCINVEIIKRPIIEIEEIRVNSVKFGELLNVSINLLSNADVEAKIVLKRNEKRIGENNLSVKRGKNMVILTVNTLKLKPGKNDLEILIAYDGYETNKNFSFYIENVGFFKKILLLLKSIEIF